MTNRHRGSTIDEFMEQELAAAGSAPLPAKDFREAMTSEPRATAASKAAALRDDDAEAPSEISDREGPRQ